MLWGGVGWVGVITGCTGNVVVLGEREGGSSGTVLVFSERHPG